MTTARTAVFASIAAKSAARSPFSRGMRAADRLRALTMSVVVTASMLAGVQVLAATGGQAHAGAELAQTAPAAARL